MITYSISNNVTDDITHNMLRDDYFTHRLEFCFWQDERHELFIYNSRVLIWFRIFDLLSSLYDFSPFITQILSPSLPLTLVLSLVPTILALFSMRENVSLVVYARS